MSQRVSRTFLFLFVLCALLVVDSSRKVDETLVQLAQDSPDQFAAYFHDLKTAEGEDGPTYRPGYRLQALEAMQAVARKGSPALPWAERGPGNVGGRTRAIIVDSADPTHATWIVGSVGGGIWRTTNKGLDWTPLTDHLPRLAVGALAQAPSNPSIMYAGTGEGYRNADALIGDGMFKSIDGGLTWTPLPATQSNYDFLFVNRLIVSPEDANHVIAATNGGIWQTLDGGSVWTELKRSTVSAGFYQILHQPGNFDIQYAVETGRGLWKSTNAGVDWFLINQGLPQATSGDRIELDVSPVNTNRLFALVEDADNPDPIYVSDNSGLIWTKFEDNNTTNPFDIAGTQGWYDLAVKAHPFDADIVFMGGIGLFRVTLTGNSTVSQFVANQNNTASFLSFVNFGAEHLNGGLRLGTDEPESTITPEKMVPVEIRFGPGKSQRAHRFVPPDVSGVDLVTYPYVDYVTVPFEAWDTQNNRQLMVSFRDRNNNGQFDLIEYDANNVGREYIFVHARPYSATTPDPDIEQTGGVTKDLAYFLWPVLAAGAEWSPSSLPESSLQFFWQDAAAISGSISSIGSGVHADQHIMVTTPTSSSNFEIVLGNDGGVFYSGNGGTSWVDRDRGYNTSQYYGIDKKPGAAAFIGGTQDNGSWRSFVNPMPSQFWLNAGGGDGFEAVWHKQNDQRLIVTSQWNFFQRSLNGGQSWTGAMSGLTDTGSSEEGAQFLTVIDQDPTNSERLFTVGKSGVWRSIDFAESWRAVRIPEEDWGWDLRGGRGKVRVSLKDPRVVWAGSEMDAVPKTGDDEDGKLHVSTNGGTSFTSVPTPSIAPGRISNISTSYDDSATVYVSFAASNRAKIIRSTDLGQTWEDLSGFDPGPDGLISQNGFPDVAVFDVLDFPDSARLWAATEIGIVESIDNGASWSIADNGLPAVAVWQLRLLDGLIVAATHGRGVWTLSLDELPHVAAIKTEVEEPTLPQKVSIDSIFPNPFQDSATIAWNGGLGGQATIRIIDLQGRVVQTVFSGSVSPGQQQTKITAQGMASGSYFIQIELQDAILTRSFIRTK